MSICRKTEGQFDVTLSKIGSTMSSCGAKSIKQLQETARITPVSSTSLIEGGAHDVILKKTNTNTVMPEKSFLCGTRLQVYVA